MKPRKKPKTDINANTEAGRVLLALRPASMGTDEIRERFGYTPNALPVLVRRGLVEKFGCDNKNYAYRLTPAGRAACPYRNPLAAIVPALSGARV